MRTLVRAQVREGARTRAPRRRPSARRARRGPPPIRVAEREVRVPDLDPRHDGLRIAHLSDVHAGHLTPRAHVRRAVELANMTQPDIVALTGDYVSWHRSEIPIMGEVLRGLRAERVVATLGNHDYYAGGHRVARALARCGYDVLHNQHVTVRARGADLHLVGVDDPVTGRHDLGRAFVDVPAQGTRVVLCHCPEQAETIAGIGADLILSGHTHGGQIFVKGITDRVFERIGRRYLSGMYKLERSHLYVTSGVGYSGIRLRAGRGTRAEVAVITLRAA